VIYSVEIKELYYKHPGKEDYILNGVNLKVKKGEAVAIIGLSGCGKSTLCYCISGIIPHIYKGNMYGEVLLSGISTSEKHLSFFASTVGIVFQDPDSQLFSPTVVDEIAFGPENLCIEREKIDKRIKEVLKQVNMERHLFNNPNNLSGGQKQLIALASVLSLKPEIIIFDETLAQIDKEGKKLIKNRMMSLKREGKTIIMIDHDHNNLDIADRIMVLKEGKLENFQGS
jgi:energy-coupling factor transport system ATP-binding protein